MCGGGPRKVSTSAFSKLKKFNASHERASDKQMSYGRVSHGCVSDGRMSRERIPHGRASHGRVCYRRVFLYLTGVHVIYESSLRAGPGWRESVYRHQG